MSIHIVHLCRDYAVVVKPYGILSEGTSPDALPVILEAELKQAGTNFESIHPVHRLDRTTEGLILLALNKKAAAQLSQMVQERQIQKHYTAFLTRDAGLAESDTLIDYLFFDKRADKSFVASKTKTSAKLAQLTYTLTETRQIGDTAVTRAEIDMLTGRTHQIRVQFASRKSPLIGDRKYGSRVHCKAPALLCTGIVFEWKGEMKTYSIPAEFPVV
ncbi:MAG: RNA pseudouridine synthase [Clostridia bacterium]|nr:RNA pseudouridine synthase [Clostridia bacterium]